MGINYQPQLVSLPDAWTINSTYHLSISFAIDFTMLGSDNLVSWFGRRYLAMYLFRWCFWWLQGEFSCSMLNLVVGCTPNRFWCPYQIAWKHQRRFSSIVERCERWCFCELNNSTTPIWPCWIAKWSGSSPVSSAGFFKLAPASTNNWVTLKWPHIAAKCNGVKPRALETLSLQALASRSSCTTSKWPPWTDKCNAVVPRSVVIASRFFDTPTNKLTTCTWPNRAAKVSGVKPW